MKLIILLSINLAFGLGAYAATSDVACEADSISTFDAKTGNIFIILNSINNRNYDPCKVKMVTPTSKKELCSMSGRDFQSLLCTQEGNMGFANEGGLFGLPTGICWWHSQFQRQATYLAYYNKTAKKLNPDNKKDKQKIKKIFNQIIRRKGPVEIPGYASLFEFTSDPKIKKLLQRRLQDWMAVDSFVKMEWFKGIFIPENYSKKEGDNYRKGKYSYQPYGAKYEKDMIQLAVEEVEQKTFSSEIEKLQAIEKKVSQTKEKIKMKQNGYEKMVRIHYSKKYSGHALEVKVLSTKVKGEKQYNRNTYKNDELRIKEKEKTIKHQMKEVNKIFEQVNTDNEISYITIQNTGIAAHAAIILDAKKIINPDTGKEEFEFKVQDSNYATESSTSRNFNSRPFSRIKFADGKWSSDSLGAGSFYHQNFNVKVHNARKLNMVNKTFEKQCGKSLFAHRSK